MEKHTILNSKNEKIVAAMYIVSNLISDSEPIKWKIRELSLCLLSANSQSKGVPTELASYLRVAYYSGMMSEMNYTVLNQELEKLNQPIVALSSLFFDLEKEFTNPAQTLNSKRISGVPSISRGDKPTRQNIIIEMLKKQPNLSIKDFSGAIKDCSEKTIQRELLALLQKGLLKREGERRWSTYSLSNI